MKAYLSVFHIRRKMELQYRGAMLGGILCQMFFGLILISLYRALYASKPQELPISHVVSYVWLQQAFFRMLLASDPDLGDKIRTGSISYDLCRPMDLYGSLMRGIPMLCFALFLPRGWGLTLPSSPPGLAISVLALILGLLCVCALENITMAFTMRTLDAKGVQAMLNLLMLILAGNILPLTLFPDSWQKVITLLPYAQLLDAPIRFYTGEYGMDRALRILLVQIVWVFLLTLLGRLMWSRNQKRLILQGG